MRLLINVLSDRLEVAMMDHGAVTGRWTVLHFEAAREIQNLFSVDVVWIDGGYLSEEVSAAAKQYGWSVYRAENGGQWEVDLIHYATNPKITEALENAYRNEPLRGELSDEVSRDLWLALNARVEGSMNVRDPLSQTERELYYTLTKSLTRRARLCGVVVTEGVE